MLGLGVQLPGLLDVFGEDGPRGGTNVHENEGCETDKKSSHEYSLLGARNGVGRSMQVTTATIDLITEEARVDKVRRGHRATEEDMKGNRSPERCVMLHRGQTDNG